MELLGERIRRLRKQSHLTQQDVAKRCGVTETAVHYWEGHFVKPRADSLMVLARMFGVSLDLLVTGNETPQLAALHRAIRARAPHDVLLAMVGEGR